jgi:hypothetical protein
MPEYDTLPHVIAKIRARIGSGGWHEFGPGDAVTVKKQAAAWFRAQRFTKPKLRILFEIAQTSPQVDDIDGNKDYWVGNPAKGLEYAAEKIESYPTWGRSR